MHIPKTAGTSIRHLVSEQFDESRIYPALLWNDIWDKYDKAPGHIERYSNSKKYSFISGHFGYKIDRVFPERALNRFTILRDPIERSLSFFFHLQNNTTSEIFVSDQTGKLHLLERPFSSLTSILEDKIFSTLFNNIQTRYLAVDYDSFQIRSNKDTAPDFSHRLVGIKLNNSHIQLAKNRLVGMSFGIQEYFFVSQWLIGRELGIDFNIDTKTRHMDYQRKINKSNINQQEYELLAILNKFDTVLYDFASSIFLERVSKQCKLLGISPPKSIKDLQDDSQIAREIALLGQQGTTKYTPSL